MSASRFESFLQRVFQATGVTSQIELASVLKINRSAITQARKKNSIPDKWILKLYQTYGLNLEDAVGPKHESGRQRSGRGQEESEGRGQQNEVDGKKRHGK